ncbi:MAG: tetratricopeptide repeat protein, partial [Bacteroidota bacterium]|nr:tetratricopeptide repeat protein [Bacteroidota bacterium]
MSTNLIPRKSPLITLFFSLFVVILSFLGSGCGTKTKDKGGDTAGSSNPKDLALLYLSHNHLDEAVAAFKQAIKMKPDDI